MGEAFKGGLFFGFLLGVGFMAIMGLIMGWH